MERARDHLCHRYLNHLYRELTPYSYAESYKKKDLAATQGEILYDSINKLLASISLGEEDVFFDLGSGTGRVTAQVFLKSPVRQACGIEFIPELHAQSLRIARQIETQLPEFYLKERKLRFIEGNFLETPFSEATVVLMNSVCFSQQTLAQVAVLIDSNPQIHSLLSLRPLPGIRRLRFVKTLRTECTWDTALCYLYQAPA
jgi:SAM-dependent methyltransferase